MVRLKIWKKIYPERWVLPQGCTEAEMQPFFGILTLVTFLWSAWVYWITFSLEFCAPMTCPFLLRSRNSCKNLTYDWGLQGLNWFLTQKNKCISLFRRFKPWYRTMGKINIWSMGAPLFETFAHLKLLYICSFGLLVGVQGLKNNLSQRRGSLKQKKNFFRVLT